MSMKTKTTYGIFGIVAVAAILSVALIASTTTPSAQAAAANKFAFAENSTAVSVQLGPVDVKSSDKNNWHVGFTGECKNFSEVKAKGKKGDSSELSGAVSGATATLIVDEGTADEQRLYSWQLCENDLQIEADLNALIEFNATSGQLEFVCDDYLTNSSDACQQWVAVSSAVSGAYHTEWVVEDVKAGDHTFEVLIEMTADKSGDETDAALSDEPNGVESMVTITQKILTADTVHIANPNS
jgi:hypothetical protein